MCCFFFFFQAEDGIRDLTVTGVQTCALPISHYTSVGSLSQTVGGEDARALTPNRTECERPRSASIRHGHWPEDKRPARLVLSHNNSRGRTMDARETAVGTVLATRRDG